MTPITVNWRPAMRIVSPIIASPAADAEQRQHVGAEHGDALRADVLGGREHASLAMAKPRTPRKLGAVPVT